MKPYGRKRLLEGDLMNKKERRVCKKRVRRAGKISVIEAQQYITDDLSNDIDLLTEALLLRFERIDFKQNIMRGFEMMPPPPTEPRLRDLLPGMVIRTEGIIPPIIPFGPC